MRDVNFFFIDSSLVIAAIVIGDLTREETEKYSSKSPTNVMNALRSKVTSLE